jgi:D-amino-acid dehydrogenase
MQTKVTIVGGGIIGLSCAYYLQKGGYQVTLIDRGDITGDASFDHAGHVFSMAPAATAGKALRSILNASSLDKDLIRWVMASWRSASKRTMARHILPLNRLLQRSHGLLLDMRDDLGNHFRMEERGCLVLYQTDAGERREIGQAIAAAHLGLTAVMLDGNEVQVMQPRVETKAWGGVFYPMDCQLHPGELIATLKARLIFSGVTFLSNTEVTGFRVQHDRLRAVMTNNGELEADEWVLAAGAGMPELTGKLGIRLLLQPGKSYSMTYPDVAANLSCPATLSERRIALTPMGKDLHIGGTMNLNERAIFKEVKAYFPGLVTNPPEIGQIRRGVNPLSPDGLPYIGRYRLYRNLILAGGHGIFGLSLAAATGNMVEELLFDRGDLADLPFFSPERFCR